MIRHGRIIVNFVDLSSVFGFPLVFVTFLSLSLLLGDKLNLVRLNSFTDFVLLLPNLFSLRFILGENTELILTYVIFTMGSVGIYL